jgi:hypothetical protein
VELSPPLVAQSALTPLAAWFTFAVLRIRRGLPPEFYVAAVLMLVAFVFGVTELALLMAFVVTGKHGWLTAATWEKRGLSIAGGLTMTLVLYRFKRGK